MKNAAEKIIHAEEMASRCLADFNELDEAGMGDSKKAQRLIERGQYWLDRYNKLVGNA